MTKIELGAMVRDKLTGFTGIAIARCEHLNSCTQIQVQPKLECGSTTMAESHWIDEPRIIQM